MKSRKTFQVKDDDKTLRVDIYFKGNGADYKSSELKNMVDKIHADIFNAIAQTYYPQYITQKEKKDA